MTVGGVYTNIYIFRMSNHQENSDLYVCMNGLVCPTSLYSPDNSLIVQNIYREILLLFFSGKSTQLSPLNVL